MNQDYMEAVAYAESDLEEFLPKCVEQKEIINQAFASHRKNKIKLIEMEQELRAFEKLVEEEEKQLDLEYKRLEEYQENVRKSLNIIHEYKEIFNK